MWAPTRDKRGFAGALDGAVDREADDEEQLGELGAGVGWVIWSVFRLEQSVVITVDNASLAHLEDAGGRAHPGSLRVRMRSHQRRLTARIVPTGLGRSLRLNDSPPVFHGHVEEHDNLVITGTIRETRANALLPWGCVLTIASSVLLIFLGGTDSGNTGTRAILVISGVGLGVWMISLLIVVLRGRRRRFGDQAAALRGRLAAYLNASGR